MRAELTLNLSVLYGFLLVLARVSACLVFVPLPGIRQGPDMARLVLALVLTAALFPSWPAVITATPGAGTMAFWLLAEAAFGLTVGVAVALLIEGFVLACQILGLQAGYSYASTVDPTSQADSSILLVFAQLTGSLMLLAFGLDRQVILAFAKSLEVYPPGHYSITAATAGRLLDLGAGMFSTALRLALPLVALSMLIDLALALLGRLNGQLQLLTLAFPIKMMATLAVLSSIAALFPAVFTRSSERFLAYLTAVLRG